MKICIVGWYGTETMGDRAILDGILTVFSVLDKHLIVQIGSLYPFYTNRTLYEEKDIYEKVCGSINNISVFDVKEKCSIEETIKNSELLIFGGGPLMDLEELSIMRYCFKLAHERGIPSIVMGCGIGPLKEERFISLVKEIFRYASLVILRDEYSYRKALELGMWAEHIFWIGDPAVISVESYKEAVGIDKIKSDVAVINFRKFPESEYGKKYFFNQEVAFQIIKYTSELFEKVILVPMHTFFIGGDDRAFFAEIVDNKKMNNVNILFHPLNLYELYEFYATATACIGMRYHSVLMQTILNGNNYIFNYTNNAGEKIKGFIEGIAEKDFYKNRIWNMNTSFEICRLSILLKMDRIDCPMSKMKSKYVNVIEDILK